MPCHCNAVIAFSWGKDNKSFINHNKNIMILYYFNYKSIIIMTGEHMKHKIATIGYSITDVAKLIGSNQPKLSQSLSSQDIKTGLVEKIAQVLNKPVSFFFDEISLEKSTPDNNTLGESREAFYQQQINNLSKQVDDLSKRNHELQDEIINMLRKEKGYAS